jgi:phosphohistidine phosphatase
VVSGVEKARWMRVALMELYFLRHGKAVEPGSSGAGDDFGRQLTEQGIDEMEAEAEAFERLGLKPDVILTSPLVRAKETAEIVAKRLGLKKRLIVAEPLSSGCDLERLRNLLSQHSSAEKVMLVGHEPDFSSMVGELIGGGASSVEIKKAAVAAVTINRSARPGSGTLRWLLPPRVLRLCGGKGVADDDSILSR